MTENLSAMADKKPTTERQTRELARLKEPEAQAQAWQQAVETAPEGKVTAKHVAEVVKRMLPDKPVPTQEDVTEEDEGPFNATVEAMAVDELIVRLLGAWPENESLQPLIDAISFNLKKVRSKQDAGPSPSWAGLEAIHKARAADVSLQNWVTIQANLEKQFASPEMRKALFLVQGGDLALLRLGLDWSVTAEKLKRAFRDAARVAHPDKGGSAKDFRRVQEDRDLVAAMLGEGGSR